MAETSTSESTPSPSGTVYMFDKWPIREEIVFMKSPLCIAFVNLIPIVPGHVLIITRRLVQHFTDLNDDEVADMWLMARTVGNCVKKLYEADGLNFAMQDGASAGQSVPHVHVHILPRRPGDFEDTNQVHKEVEKWNQPVKAVTEDKLRKPRSVEDMAAEAESIRSAIAPLLQHVEV
eukprot:GHVS01027043.1.p1 GENE.GHVS01027043.1~~GHVS01027043.1.p1  ORF type:complete len:177 (+),score=25.03 GHVS01027043.1:372-902(+)